MLKSVFDLERDERVLYMEKTSTCGEQDRPHSIVLQEEDSLTHVNARKLQNPHPTRTQRHRSSCEMGPALYLCFEVGRIREIFFNAVNCATPDK